jgi:4a-hydroxytetrahydrobiopterin dehydratase
VSPLTPQECSVYLAEVADWQVGSGARTLARRFRFADYRSALAFANRVSALAEEAWHHPELVLGWGFCEVSLTTRKIGGLHEFDFVMAARIDVLSTEPVEATWLPPLPPPRNIPASPAPVTTC